MLSEIQIEVINNNINIVKFNYLYFTVILNDSKYWDITHKNNTIRIIQIKSENEKNCTCGFVRTLYLLAIPLKSAYSNIQCITYSWRKKQTLISIEI